MMTFGRHVAADGTVPGKQFEYMIDDFAIGHTSYFLSGIPAPVAEELMRRLDRLPDSTPFADALRNEKRWSLTWLREAAATPEGVARFARELEAQTHWEANFRAGCIAEWRDEARRTKALSNLESLHDEMIQIVEGPPHDRWDRFASRYGARQQSLGGLAHALAPVMGHATAEPLAQVRLALLKAAVAVRARGTEELQAYKDPFGDGPFEYRQTPRGFVLRSKLIRADDPVELRVEIPEEDEDEE